MLGIEMSSRELHTSSLERLEKASANLPAKALERPWGDDEARLLKLLLDDDLCIYDIKVLTFGRTRLKECLHFECMHSFVHRAR